MAELDSTEVIAQFQFEGEYKESGVFGFGHINDTYLVSFQNESKEPRRYILQRINKDVFKNPQQVMENIQRVTQHLREKIVTIGGNPKRETLSPVLTRSDEALYKAPNDSYWRAYLYIEDALSYNNIETLQHAYHGAKAFALFQKQLIDFDVDQLHETIPNFHHTPKRYQAFCRALALDEFGRAKDVAQEIEFVIAREDGLGKIVDLLASEQLPIRVTHNDTKFNNLLLDNKTGEGVCVVDLDTVMPGSSLYDFGDAIRSGAKQGAEDEGDLSKIKFDIEIFDAYTRGYLEVLRDTLTPLEIDLMPDAARLLTLECGIRFLTDYLKGDIYYKTQYTHQNLDRCRTQLKLVSEIEQYLPEMHAIVNKYRKEEKK